MTPVGVQYAGPYIDETVEHVGITRLRNLNATSLREIDKTLVIQDNDKPLAVLLSYEQFLIMQKQLLAVLGTLDMFTNGAEADQLIKGLEDFRNGRFRPLAEVKAELKKKTGGATK